MVFLTQISAKKCIFLHLNAISPLTFYGFAQKSEVSIRRLTETNLSSEDCVDVVVKGSRHLTRPS